MNLGVFPHRGGSLESWRAVGQDRRVVNYYFKKYAREFDEVYFFSYADRNERRRDLPGNVKIIPNSYGIPFTLYAFLMPLFHRSLIKKCDVFRVFHISGTPSVIVSRLLFGKPYLITYGYLWLRDILFHGKYLDYFIAKPVEWLGLKMAGKVIITLEKTREYVRRFVPPKKIASIPNGVDTKLFRKMRVKKAGKRIISIGRFMKIKNYDSLVKAVSRLEEAELVLFGAGPEEESLRSLAKSTGCRLTMPGVIPNERLPKEINKASVFVLPSHSEGMPKALLEVMACEMPCIVSDLPSLREVIKDGVNGLVCEKTPEGILEKLEYVFSHPKEAREMARKARKQVVDEFSIDKLMNKEIKLLKELGR